MIYTECTLCHCMPKPDEWSVQIMGVCIDCGQRLVYANYGSYWNCYNILVQLKFCGFGIGRLDVFWAISQVVISDEMELYMGQKKIPACETPNPLNLSPDPRQKLLEEPAVETALLLDLGSSTQLITIRPCSSLKQLLSGLSVLGHLSW